MSYQEKPILQGILWKQARRSGSNWKRRHFKLFSNMLTYSVKENGKEKGRMEFTEEFFVQDGKAPKGKFGFLVTNFEVAHHLAADSKDQKEFWCHAIATIIRKLLDKARYFDDVRKSMKVVDEDLLEKQYQARLDNYYRTVGRPADKQNRRSIVDLRAAQVLAEANEARDKADKAHAAEKELLRQEAERLSKEAEIMRQKAERGDPSDSVTVGPTIAEEDEAGEGDDDDDDGGPEIPPMPSHVEEHHVAVPPINTSLLAESTQHPLSPSKKLPPLRPPRKNTIQAQSSALLSSEESNTQQDSMFTLAALAAAASPSSASSSRKPSLMSAGSGGSFSGMASSPVASPRPSVVGTSGAGSAAATTAASPRPSITDANVTGAASPTAASARPSVVGISGTVVAGPTSPAAASARPSIASPTTATDRRPTLQQQTAIGEHSESKSSAVEAPSRKATVTEQPAAVVEPVPSRKPTVTTPPASVTSSAPPSAERKTTITSPPAAAVVHRPSLATTTSPAAAVKSEPSPQPAAVKTSEEKAAPPKASGGIASKLGMWQNKVDQHQEKQANNVFSGSYQGKGKVEINKEHYGKAPEGSKTEERAKAAADWVEKEIEKLIDVILEMGEYDPEEGGIKTVKFGPLFYKYADISDTLVGILMRAKKRKKLMYQGDMLFQTMHDHVKITVLQAA